MPKVTQVKAGKDYPEFGIKKGELHYTWAHYRQKPQRSLTPPKASQLCNPKLADAYDARDQLEAAIIDAKCPEDLVNALNEAAGGVESSMDQYDESISNLEEAFPGGNPLLEEMQETREQLETYKDELETAAQEIEGLDVDDYITEDQYTLDKKPEDFDGLNEEDQEQYMNAAREIAEGPSLDA